MGTGRKKQSKSGQIIQNKISAGALSFNEILNKTISTLLCNWAKKWEMYKIAQTVI